MKTLLQGWKGQVEVNGNKFSSVTNANFDCNGVQNSMCIKLYPVGVKRNTAENNSDTSDDKPVKDVIITVKRYMTQPSTPEFDFMTKWNNNNPMPLRTMVGHKIKETPGMVYMELHGDIIATKVVSCMKCGKKLTNPVSQYFGIGPECGHHNYVNPFNTDEELQEAVASYKKQLQNITWTGWIIKSAIIKEEDFVNG